MLVVSPEVRDQQHSWGQGHGCFRKLGKAIPQGLRTRHLLQGMGPGLTDPSSFPNPWFLTSISDFAPNTPAGLWLIKTILLHMLFRLVLTS